MGGVDLLIVLIMVLLLILITLMAIEKDHISSP